MKHIENGDDLRFIFEGAGTKWIGELEDENHKLHGLYKGLKEHVTGACAGKPNILLNFVYQLIL